MAVVRLAVETVEGVAGDSTLTGSSYAGTTDTDDQYLVNCATGDVFVYAKNTTAVETTVRVGDTRDSFGHSGQTTTLGTLASNGEGFFGPIDPSKHADSNGDATLDATGSGTIGGTVAVFRTRYGTL